MDFVAKLNTASFFASSRDILRESNKIREELNKASQSFLNQNDQKRIVDSLDKIRDVIGRDKASGMQNAFQNIAAGVNAASVAQSKMAMGIGKASENAKELNKWNTYIKNNMKDVEGIYANLNTEGQLLTANMVMTNLETSRLIDGLSKAEQKAGGIAAKFLALQGLGDALKNVFSTGAIGAAGQSVMGSINDEMALTAQLGRSGISSLLSGARGINAGQSSLWNQYNANGGLSMGNLLLQQNASIDTIMKSANAGGLGVQAGIANDSQMAQFMMSMAAYGPNLSAQDRMTMLAQIQASSKAGGATTMATTQALTGFLGNNAGFFSGMEAATGAAGLMAAASGTGAGPQFATMISDLITAGRKDPGSPQARALQILFNKTSGEINQMARTGDYSGLRLNANFLGDLAAGGEGSEALQTKLKALGLDSNAISMSIPGFNQSMAKTEGLRVRPEDAQQQLLDSLSESRDAFTNLTESLKGTITQSELLRNAFYGVYSAGNAIASVGTSVVSIVTLLASMKTLGVGGAAGGLLGAGGMAGMMSAMASLAVPAVAVAIAAGGGYLLGNAIASWFGMDTEKATIGETLAALKEEKETGRSADSMAARLGASKHVLAEALRQANPRFADKSDEWLIDRNKEYGTSSMTDDPRVNVAGLTTSDWVKPKFSPSQHIAMQAQIRKTVEDATSRYIAGHTPTGMPIYATR
jgi:hypothetical protein